MAHYELRIAYSSDSTIGEGDVLARAPDIRDLADRFAESTAPFKTIIFVDGSGADWLDEWETQVLAEACAKRGLAMVEVDGDAA